MTPNNFSTIRDLLRYAVTRFNTARLFFGHGSSNALDEAAYLILHTLKLPLDKLDPFLDARLLPDEVNAVLKVIDQRTLERLPAAYITNEAWLGAYRFFVDQRVIVPRSFIAELIPDQFSPWVDDPESVTAILELCTGSGCLPIMLADAFPNAQVDAVDISADALAVAQRNVDEYELQDRVTLIESDLYAKVPTKKYDLIVTNPPYVTNDETDALPQEYSYEPEMGLRAGDDGLDLVLKILRDAPLHLSEDGLLICEVGESEQHLVKLLPEVDFAWIEFKVGQMGIFAVECRELIAHSARITELAAQRP